MFPAGNNTNKVNNNYIKKVSEIKIDKKVKDRHSKYVA